MLRLLSPLTGKPLIVASIAGVCTPTKKNTKFKLHTSLILVLILRSHPKPRLFLFQKFYFVGSWITFFFFRRKIIYFVLLQHRRVFCGVIWKGYNKLDTKLREIVERFIMARRKFDKQFKNSAVKLILEEGYSVKEVSQELEVHANSLYRWVQEVEEYGESAFPGNGTALADAQHKIKLLEKENRYLQEELELLKKSSGSS